MGLAGANFVGKVTFRSVNLASENIDLQVHDSQLLLELGCLLAFLLVPLHLESFGSGLKVLCKAEMQDRVGETRTVLQ